MIQPGIQPGKQEVAKSDWTGALAILWIIAFVFMCGWAVYWANTELLKEIVALLGAATLLVLKFYFDKAERE